MVNVTPDVYTVREAVAAGLVLSRMPFPKGIDQLTDILMSHRPLPLEEADGVIEYVHRMLTFKTLRNDLKDFERHVMVLLGQPNQPAGRLLVMLIHVTDMYHRLRISEDLAEVTMTSQYQGTAGQVIVNSLVVMRCDYIESHNFYAAVAVDDNGNAYSFSPKFQLVIGEVIRIRAKIKQHKPDSYNNDTPTTYLNYVKFL